MSEIRKVTSEDANKIIENREPKGLFYAIELHLDKKIYVGIDNSRGHAWTEDFKTLPACKRWLEG